MDVRKYRKEAVKRLIKDKFGDVSAAFAVAIKRDDAYVWQLITDSKSGRPIGEKTARHIEKELNLPHLYLDHPPSYAPQSREPDKLLEHILAEWPYLIDDQRNEVYNEVVSKAAANRAIAKQVGKQTKPVPDGDVEKKMRNRAAESVIPQNKSSESSKAKTSKKT